jgi:hypothetical protein
MVRMAEQQVAMQELAEQELEAFSRWAGTNGAGQKAEWCKLAHQLVSAAADATGRNSTVLLADLLWQRLEGLVEQIVGFVAHLDTLANRAEQERN